MTRDSQLNTSTNNKPIIALDCDGVLLDYQKQYAQIYEKTFGKQLTVVSPKSYLAETTYGVKLNDEEEVQFKEKWNTHGWRTMPMEDGSLEACHLLHEAGYELVCVTAMSDRFIEHRLENFRLHGYPIDRIISTGGSGRHNHHNNPKREIIEELHPVVFVDDLRRNFKDIQGVHTKFVFIDRDIHDDPNRNDQIYYDVKYPSLLHFVEDFLKTEQHGKNIIWPERPSSLLPSISS
ncbi:unnamed protein product [Adineta steineri]|uniref:Uncharacterized protein n=1 Tax=Adineta steineri TaxID=433720 RepID=A0A814D3A2_9BILA|nr:unnamed protein product [Adineta steineri]CAF1456156.1 unnamed protein product [Adineta steineri]CAF1596042.1 unnamed protein product [Adineta steineri]CAF3882519.1 unnamed protein product [Adineta steineri]